MKGITVKNALRTIGVALVAGAMVIGFVSCGSRARAEGKLQIMYSGNLRGAVAPCGCHTPKGGIPRWVAFMKRHADPDAYWLSVDAGNYVDRGATPGCSNKCQFLIGSYRDLHYDVLNIGKQEAWMGRSTLKQIIDTTKGTGFVSANLIDMKTRRPLAKPYIIKDYGKLRVGVLGLLNEADFPKGSMLLDSTELTVAPHMEACRKYIPSLAKKVNALVVLAELSTPAIDSLVRAFPEIDLVISTGAVQSGETPTIIGKTRVMGTGSSGYNGHYAMLEFHPAWKDSIGFLQFQDQLIATYDESGPWADRLTAFNAASSAPKKVGH